MKKIYPESEIATVGKYDVSTYYYKESEEYPFVFNSKEIKRTCRNGEKKKSVEA